MSRAPEQAGGGLDAARGTYVLTFAALAVLTGLTIVVAFFDLGVAGPIVALSIATAKALLVLLFFMHVRHSSALTRLMVGAGFGWLLIMIVLTLSDYGTRDW